ncbi:ketopantoate reductase family protein [Sporolactobacillus shoreae]|uniref:2-dehydropantoate 2-reductase n=1 Tax=Sporolactobacillus shoreae TaxID=1465501 RepID=A0A4Z0GQR9_9BACL|nr:ketopantoate reductase family protein [Sporolactobacillus shoreae]TGA98423.1 ketopantoate reductase family protein [Sporolactobacillus shoreae]
MKQIPKIVIFGAGAIGGSMGAWIANQYDNIYFVARGENEKIFRKDGITTYQGIDSNNKKKQPIKVIGNIQEARDADVIVIGVKNFSLDAVAKEIKRSVGDKPIIIGIQNGLENQTILPKYFSKVIYCVVGYNAWVDQPGVIGYQKKGPLILGTENNKLAEDMKAISDIFNLGPETQITEHFQDAAHSKLVINLANSLTTLVGLNVVDIQSSKFPRFQKLFSRQLLEGIRIIRAANFKEHKIEGVPSWRQIWLLANFPRIITSKMFIANTKRFNISSMAQDVIQRNSQVSELESINGYILQMAKKYGVKAPVNQTIYQLCKESFSKPGFKPMDIDEVWEEVIKLT